MNNGLVMAYHGNKWLMMVIELLAINNQPQGILAGEGE